MKTNETFFYNFFPIYKNVKRINYRMNHYKEN